MGSISKIKADEGIKILKGKIIKFNITETGGLAIQKMTINFYEFLQKWHSYQLISDTYQSTEKPEINYCKFIA